MLMGQWPHATTWSRPALRARPGQWTVVGNRAWNTMERSSEPSVAKNRRGVHGEGGIRTTGGFWVMWPDVSSIPWRQRTPPAGKGIDHRTGGAVTPPEQER
jgi:hypothetical protein